MKDHAEILWEKDKSRSQTVKQSSCRSVCNLSSSVFTQFAVLLWPLACVSFASLLFSPSATVDPFYNKCTYIMRIVRSPASRVSICSIKVLPKVKSMFPLSFMLVLDLAETTPGHSEKQTHCRRCFQIHSQQTLKSIVEGRYLSRDYEELAAHPTPWLMILVSWLSHRVTQDLRQHILNKTWKTWLVKPTALINLAVTLLHLQCVIRKYFS